MSEGTGGKEKNRLTKNHHIFNNNNNNNQPSINNNDETTTTTTAAVPLLPPPNKHLRGENEEGKAIRSNLARSTVSIPVYNASCTLHPRFIDTVAYVKNKVRSLGPKKPENGV